jgi:hypothetical protein
MIETLLNLNHTSFMTKLWVLYAGPYERQNKSEKFMQAINYAPTRWEKRKRKDHIQKISRGETRRKI